MTDGYNIKAIPKAYHVATARLFSRLPEHDVLRRRPDGTAHQLFNILVGEGLDVIRQEVERFEDSRFPSTVQTDQLSWVYQAQVPPSWSSPGASPNFLLNSDFCVLDEHEQLPFMWSSYTPDGWSAGSWELSNDAWYGTRCVKVTLEPGQGVAFLQALRDFKTSYADPIAISAWVKKDGGSPMVAMPLIIKNMANGQWSSFLDSTQEVSGTEWERIYNIATEALTPIDEARAVIQLTNPGSETAVIYLDCPQVEKAKVPTRWRWSDNDTIPWNVTESRGFYEVFATINGIEYPVHYCDNGYDFLRRAVPTRASIQADERFAYLPPTSEFGSKLDVYAEEWRMGYSISGGSIIKENLDVDGEIIASYEPISLTRSFTWAAFETEMLQLTVMRSLLVVLDKLDGEYGLMFLNPQYEVTEASHIHLLRRIPIVGIDNVLPDNFEIELGNDDENIDMLGLRVRDLDADTFEDYRIRLRYDYFIPNDDGSSLMMREDYREDGGVTIR